MSGFILVEVEYLSEDPTFTLDVPENLYQAKMLDGFIILGETTFLFPFSGTIGNASDQIKQSIRKQIVEYWQNSDVFGKVKNVDFYSVKDVRGVLRSDLFQTDTKEVSDECTDLDFY